MPVTVGDYMRITRPTEGQTLSSQTLTVTGLCGSSKTVTVSISSRTTQGNSLMQVLDAVPTLSGSMTYGWASPGFPMGSIGNYVAYATNGTSADTKDFTIG
jgi:hypothetical protein